MRFVLSGLLVTLLALVSSCGGGGNSGAGGGGGSGTLYKSTVYADGDIAQQADITYSHRPNEGGKQYTSDTRKASELGTSELTLLLDVWVPPNAQAGANQPLVIWVHGGGYNMGGKEDRATDALSYAKAGYVTASVNYRLTPSNDVDGATRTKAIEQAADDLMNAIRYLKLHAGDYHIDVSRIAVVGTSAGGGLALTDAIEPDTLDNTLNDYPGTSAKVTSVVSTGATLIDPLFNSDALLTYDADDSPVLLLHAKPEDPETHATWTDNVLPTQQRINGAGDTCIAVATGSNHTVLLAMDSSYWVTAVQPFLWETLRLASL